MLRWVIICLCFMGTFAQPVLKIGILYQSVGSVSYISKTILIAANMWFEGVKEGGKGIANTGIQPLLIYEDCGNNTAEAVAATNKLIAQGVVVIIAPSGNQTPNVALAALNKNVIVFSGEAASSDITNCQLPLALPCIRPDGSRRFPHLISPFTPNSQLTSNIFSELKLQGLKTLAIISLDGAAHMDVCVTGGATYAQQNGFKIVYQSIIPYNGQTENVTLSDEYILRALNEFESLQPDVLCFANRFACARIFTMMQNAKYIPKQIYTFQCVDTLPTTVAAVGDIARYFLGSPQWDYRLVGYDEPVATAERPYATTFSRANYSQLPSPMQFYNKYNAQPNAKEAPINSLTPYVFVSLYTIEYAAFKCNCTTFAGLSAAIPTVYMQTFAGFVTVDDNGNNFLKPAVDMQIDQNLNPQIITPISSATMSLINPIPPWVERIYVHQMYALPEEKVVFGLTAICCAMGIVVVVLLWRNRGNKHIKASSWELCIPIACGQIIGCISVLFWPVENDEITCGARLPIFSIGFCLFFALLDAKTDRLASIFTGKLIVKFLPDRLVFGHGLIIACTMFFPIILWMGVSPLEVTIVVTDPLRPEFNYANCESANYAFGYWTATITLCILFHTMYRAWQIRMIPTEHFQDSRSVFTCVFLFGFIIIVIGAIQFAFGVGDTSLNQRRVLFVVRSTGIQLAYTTGLVSLFFNRLWAIRSTWFAEKFPCGDPLSVQPDQHDSGSKSSQRDSDTESRKIEEGTIVGRPSTPSPTPHHRGHNFSNLNKSGSQRIRSPTIDNGTFEFQLVLPEGTVSGMIPRKALATQPEGSLVVESAIELLELQRNSTTELASVATEELSISTNLPVTDSSDIQTPTPIPITPA